MELDLDEHPISVDNTMPSAFTTAPLSTANDLDELNPAVANPSPGDQGPSNAATLTMDRSSSLMLRSIHRSGIEVYAWGRGDCGQLGLGAATLTDTFIPQRVEALLGKNILCMAAGSFHTAALTADGEVYTWGANDEGQCARKDAEQVTEPRRVEALENFKIAMVSCGSNHTIAVAEDGAVFGFGAADFGQLGLGPISGSKVVHPKPCRALRDAHVLRAAAGGNHTLFLEAAGAVHATGDASYGALGIGGGTNSASVYTPQQLLRLWPMGVCQIATGEAHSAALTLDGRLFTWGRGRAGALGLGDFQNSKAPVQVQALSGIKLKQITCGGDHTVAVTGTGEMFAWGQGKWGATGLGHCDAVCTPQRVVGLEDEVVVQVSAGGRHTVLLTEKNEVWAMGSNDNGQCGNSVGSSYGHGGGRGGNDNITSGSGAVDAIVDDESLGRSFDNTSDIGTKNEIDENMEVGVASSEDALERDRDSLIILRPRKVAGMPPSDGKIVLYVVAGGDHSLAVVEQSVLDAVGEPLLSGNIASGPLPQRPHGERWLPAAPQPLLPLVRAALAEVATASAGGSYIENGRVEEAVKSLKACIDRTFGNPVFLIESLKLSSTSAGVSSDGAAVVNMREPGSRIGVPALDLAAISEMYQGILKLYDQGVVTVLGTASIRLLDTTERYLAEQYPATPGKISILGASLNPDLAWVPPTLFIALQNPLASDPGTYGSAIILRLGRILSTTLPAGQRVPVRRALQTLLTQLPADAFAARCVRPVQRYLTHLVTSGRLGAGRLEAMMAGVLLDVLLQANEAAGGKISYSEFYNNALSNALDLQAEYISWVKHRENSPNALVSFCQMPFLLNPEAKSNILHGESMMQKQQHMSAAAMQAFFRGESPSDAGFLWLSVRRTHVVEDAMTALARHGEDLKKPLRVKFISGGVAEPAQDEGGVRKEFFQLLTRDLFRPEFGMFTYDEVTRTHWFNMASLESEHEYEMVGALMGLAIYNAVLLDAHFPLVLYEKILGGKPNFADLKAAFPELGRGLQALLDYAPAEDVESIFCRTFEVEYEYYGEMQRRDLIPGGKEISVTENNRQQYVTAYTAWLLEDSISTQFSAFARGFLKVCGGPALSMFTPAELELLVCGLPHLDFDGLQKAARYEGGYYASTPVVQWFWEIVRHLNLEQKRQFLTFTTGSDRAPVGGLSRLSICIQRAGPDTDRLPTSHTCFDTLLLPEYSSKEKLKGSLLTAITNAEGFGLQ